MRKFQRLENAALAALLAFAAAGAARAELHFQEVVLDNSYFAYERDVGDVDGDGDNDVVAIQEGETKLEVFKAPTWARSTLVTFTGTYRWPRADDFKVGDIDGDGDMDLITRLGAGPSDDGAGLAVWCENLGAGTGWVTRTIGNSTAYVKDIVVADFDRDTRPDVAMRMDSATQLWLQEPGGTWTEVLLNHAAHEGLEAADVDMDGDPDLILNGFWLVTPDTPATCRVAGNYATRTIDSAWFTQAGDWTANSCKVVAGDFDGDGSNDVAFSQSERAGYAVTWYRRHASPTGDSWVARAVVNIDHCHNLQAADWDLDGDVDLLVGGMQGGPHQGLRLMRNEGAGTNWSTFVIQSDGSYSAEVGDLDEDGDLDIVGIRNWNAAPTYIYRNNSGGPPSLHFWKYIPASSSHVRTFGLTFLDADADGDEDIASGPYLYRNPGGALTGAWAQVSAAAGAHVFLAADVDGDARADLLALQDNAGQNRIDLFWYEAQDAAAGTWSQVLRLGDVPRSDHPEGFQGSRLAQVQAGGKPEVVISTMQGLYYFLIPASPATGVWPRVFVAANDSDEGIGVADVDGDNDLDIAFTSGGSKTVKWARNPGDGSSNWTVFTLGSFPEADWPDHCEAVDLNGDGRVDVAVTEENAGGSPDALACWWEQPAGSPTNANWTRHVITTRYTMNSLDAADMDKDGDTDLVIAEHRGTEKISVFANDGLGAFTEFPVGAGAENHAGGRAVDLDHDGDLDLVGIAYDDFTSLHVWRNDSPSGVPTVAKPVISPNGGVFDEPVAVTLTCGTAGAAIRYTLTGAEPTDVSALYTNTLLITTTTTVKARGFKDGLATSTVAAATFTGPQAATPVISPPGGSFQGTQSVVITCSTTGVTLRVTTDGSAPSEMSPIYGAPLTLTTSATVRARAYRTGLAPSEETTASFTLFTLGAVAHWRLDERFGSVAYDHSGSGRTGTVVGATRVAGARDRALSFDGADDYVHAGPWSVAGTSLTLCAWVRLASPFQDNDARLISKAVGSAEQDHYWMLSLTTVSSQPRLRFRLKTGGSTTTLIASSGNLALDTWYHAAAAYDGSAMRLYLDGVEVGSVAKSGSLSTDDAVAIFLGANPPNTYAPLRGALDDVRIYNIALSASEVQAVMNEQPVSAAPGVQTITSAGAGGWQLAATAEAGHYVLLQRATNLLDPQWQALATNASVAGLVVVSDSNELPAAVYRLWLD